MRIERAAWWFVAPALLVIGVFFFLPVGAALLMSLTDFDIYALADIRNLRFVGLSNYVSLVQTPLFWQAFGNTLYFVVVGVPLSIGVSLGAALLLHSRLARFKPFFRTALFAPVVTTLVAVAVIWRYLFNTRYGLLNYALSGVGISPIDWLGDPHWAMPAIIVFAVWKNFGYNMIILLAGLQNIPEDLYEAARLDGASVWQQIPLCDAADALTHSAAGQHPHHRRLLPALCRALRDDAGRPAAKHRQRPLLHVRGRLQVVEPGLGIRRGLRALPRHFRHHRPANALRAAARRLDMKRTLAAPIVNGLLIAAAAITLFPLFWMVSTSLMPPGESTTFPPPLLPSHATLGNYRELFAHAGLGRYLANSVLLATVATLVSLVFNVSAGYAFAKLRFAGRDRIFKVLLGALVIPGQVAMVPLFLLLKHMGLVNSYGGVIVPAMASIFGIFLVRQYALSIPNELLEAARIDGASEFRIFRMIVVPLLKPIIVTLAVFTLLATWNDFMWPLIVLTDKDLYTLPVALASLSREHVQDDEMMMAGSVVTILPVLVVFLSLQRYYLQGLMAGSVKG